MTRAERSKLHKAQARKWRRNIARVFASATPAQVLDGSTWYERAHRQVAAAAARHGVDVRAMAGAVAAISPGLSWERNVYYAELLADYSRGKGQAAFGGGIKRPAVPTYSYANVEKALAVLRGGIVEDYVTGPKVSAFARLLCDPSDPDAVCIDGHAIMAARGIRRQLRDSAGAAGRPEQARIQAAYRAEARRVGLLPNQLQAIVWLAQKARETEAEEKDEAPF
jgi:hypothetical protein